MSTGIPIDFAASKLVLATNNKGKLAEFQRLFADAQLPVAVLPQAEFAIPDAIEDGLSFVENALIKARHASRLSGLPALADDSGLCVRALGGDPGLYSARWAGPEKDYGQAFKRIQEGLGDNADRTAHFICALSLAWTDGHVETFEGRIEGEITTYPRGVNGFGYDPLFIPEGYDKTFAEMDHLTKYQMSHRARALEHFITRSLAA